MRHPRIAALRRGRLRRGDDHDPVEWLRHLRDVVITRVPSTTDALRIDREHFVPRLAEAAKMALAGCPAAATHRPRQDGALEETLRLKREYWP